MAIFSVWIISRAGGLIYQYERNAPTIEVEKTFSYPLDFVLKEYDDKVVVAFGQRDGVKVGHVVMSINGIPTEGQSFKSDKNIKEDIIKYLAKEENYPLNIKFGRPKLSTNERIMLAGMFHSLFAIASQLSPVPSSSGIQLLETDTFKLHAFQTLTGIKFVIVTDIRRNNEEVLLKKLYEIYSDFALKNPFYSIDMPIRCELFDSNVLQLVDLAEKSLPF